MFRVHALKHASDAELPEKDGSDVRTVAAELPSSSDTSGAGILSSAGEPNSSREAFDTAGLEEFYKPIDSYEGRHRYDPSFQWQPKDEQRVVRKVRPDLCLYCFVFSYSSVD